MKIFNKKSSASKSKDEKLRKAGIKNKEYVEGFQNVKKKIEPDAIKEELFEKGDQLLKDGKVLLKRLPISQKEKKASIGSTMIIAKEFKEDENELSLPKSEREMINDEILSSYKLFSVLLPITYEFLAQDMHDIIPFSADELINKWKYTFSVGECNALLAKLIEFIGDGEKDALSAMKKLMEFLNDAGIRQLDEDKSTIIVSISNRANYQNGYEFRDEEECFIEEHPWTYKDTLIRTGVLTADREV